MVIELFKNVLLWTPPGQLAGCEDVVVGDEIHQQRI